MPDKLRPYTFRAALGAHAYCPWRHHKVSRTGNKPGLFKCTICKRIDEEMKREPKDDSDLWFCTVCWTYRAFAFCPTCNSPRRR